MTTQTETATDRADRIARDYGVTDSNPAPDGLHEIERETVYLTDRRLARITRLRLVGMGEPIPFVDVSYCYGVLKDGTEVRVNLPVGQFSKASIKRGIVEMCQSEGVYARGLGLLDEGNWSILR